MNFKEKLNELGRLIDNNPTAPEVLTLAAKIKSECKSDGERATVEEFVGSRLPKLTSDIDKMHTSIKIADKVKYMKDSDLLKVLNGTYLAERFFGKSCCWFSQKLNGNEKNGKPCSFSEDELKILKEALVVISLELQDLADSL